MFLVDMKSHLPLHLLIVLWDLSLISGTIIWGIFVLPVNIVTSLLALCSQLVTVLNKWSSSPDPEGSQTAYPAQVCLLVYLPMNQLPTRLPSPSHRYVASWTGNLGESPWTHKWKIPVESILWWFILFCISRTKMCQILFSWLYSVP